MNRTLPDKIDDELVIDKSLVRQGGYSMTPYYVRQGMLCTRYSSSWQVLLCVAIVFACSIYPRQSCAEELADIHIYDDEAAIELLLMLGCDHATLSAVGVSASRYQTMLSETISYIRGCNEQDIQLLGTIRQARKNRVHHFKNRNDYARNEIMIQEQLHYAEAIFPVVKEALNRYLTSDQQVMISRAARHHGLDRPLAFVDLDEQQYAILKTLQDKRDRALLNPRNWHRYHVRRHASAWFNERVQEILTPPQADELERMKNQRGDNGSLVIRGEATSKADSYVTQAKAASEMSCQELVGDYLNASGTVLALRSNADNTDTLGNNHNTAFVDLGMWLSRAIFPFKSLSDVMKDVVALADQQHLFGEI